MQIATGGVRRHECTVPAGEILPGQPFEIGIRLIAPPVEVPLSGIAFYCLPGGQTNLNYFDLGDDADRRFSFAEAMALRGHVTVVADHPGIGRSTSPEEEYDLTPDLLAEAHVGASRSVMDGLKNGTLVSGLAPMPGLVPVSCGHSMGAVMTIEVEARSPRYSGLVLLGYGSGGLPTMLSAEMVEKARDPDWLKAYLPELARERFGTARIDPAAAKAKRRGRENGSPSFHSDNADPDGRLALRGSNAPLLTMPGLYSMFPGVSDLPSARIEVPILVVTGTHDFIDAGDALREQFNRTPLLEIFRPQDTGHNLFIFPSREESFARIADWAGSLV